jgi:hypothetical protein
MSFEGWSPSFKLDRGLTFQVDDAEGRDYE